LVLSALLGLAPLIAVPTAEAAAPADCAKVEIVAFRGSGEGNVDDGDRSNGFAGPTLQRIIDVARTTVVAGGYTMKDAKVYGVPYPAVPAEKYASKDLDLFDSVEYGRLIGAGYVAKRHEACASVGTRFLLVGYSQGVLAARQTAADLPSDWVAGVFGIGDPAQHSKDSGVVGAGAAGNGIYWWLIEHDGKADSDSFYDLDVARYLYCHALDPVCDFTRFAPNFPIADGLKPHLTYGADPVERISLGQELTSMAAKAAGKPPAPSGTASGPVDLMFAIDTTGSMSPYIAAAVKSAKGVADRLHALSSKARVGLVEYRDYGDSYVARTVAPLSNDFTAFNNGLNSLSAGGGGDTPEAVYTGVVTALDVPWNRSAARALIVLGDALAHDPEEQTGLTAAKVADIATGKVPMITLPPTVGGTAGLRARSAEPDAANQAPAAASASPKAKITEAAPSATAAGTAIAPVKVYGLSASTELTGQLTTISDATGGSTAAIDASEDVAGKIIRTVEDAATAPVARLTLADTVLAGASTVLSGLSSSYTGATPTYGFDFDNDGKVDETNQDGAVRHTYPTAGPVDARLVITDTEGRTAEVTLRIDVRAANSLQTPIAGAPAPTTTTSGTVPTGNSSVPATATPSGGGGSGLAFTGLGGLPILLFGGVALVMVGGLLWFISRFRRLRANQSNDLEN
jgi:hypothetical protein